MAMSAKQIDFYKNSTANINIAHGAVRSGKTYGLNLRWLKYCVQGPPGKFLMTGRTKDSIRGNVLDDIKDIVGEANFHYKEAKGLLRIGNRIIEVYGADDVNAEKVIRGRTYAGWYGDEITIQHPALVKQAIARCSVPGSKIFWTTNPDHPKHPIKKNFIDNKEMIERGQVRSWHFTMDDNPILTPEYKELLKSSFSGVFYKRNVDGLWVIADGVVYGDEYIPSIHRVSRKYIDDMLEAKRFKTFGAGVDWGHTHPMAGLLFGVTTDDEYYLIDEFYQTKKQTEDLARWFLHKQESLYKPLEILLCDSAEPDRVMKLKEFGLPAVGCDKSIMAGISTVQTAFKNDRLFVCEEAVNTDTELQTYRFPDAEEAAMKDKYLKDMPVDADNHAMDALRYFVHNYEKILLTRKAREDARERRKGRPKSF